MSLLMPKTTYRLLMSSNAGMLIATASDTESAVILTQVQSQARAALAELKLVSVRLDDRDCERPSPYGVLLANAF